MWCATCKAEVAGEVSHDTRSIACANCGTQVSTGRSGQGSGRTRQARELLERWSTERFLDPYGPVTSPRKSGKPSDADMAGAPLPFEESLASADPSPDPSPAEDTSSPEPQPMAHPQPQSLNAEARAVAEMLEQSHSSPAPNGGPGETHEAPAEVAHQSVTSADTTAPSPASVPTRQSETQSRTLSPRSSTAFDVHDAALEASAKQASWVGVAGQFLAYGGVAVLTVGTVLVLWGHFGGPDVYAPTGWLITTAGQMLLFLGVVTLISGGLESTTREVTRRIDALARQLRRIEQVTTDDADRRREQEAEQRPPATIPYATRQHTASDSRHRDAA